jgi:hypothetical protein
VLDDPNFVFDLHRGRKPNLELVEQVDRWMKEYKPEEKKTRSEGSTRAQVCQ